MRVIEHGRVIVTDRVTSEYHTNYAGRVQLMYYPRYPQTYGMPTLRDLPAYQVSKRRYPSGRLE